MGYFLGKETLAVPSDESLKLTNAPGDGGGGDGGGGDGGGEGEKYTRCRQECDPQYTVGSPEHRHCMEICQARNDTICTEGKACVNSNQCGGKPCVNQKCQCTQPPGPGPGPNPSGCPRSGDVYTKNPTACPCGIGYSVTAAEAGKCAPGYDYIARPGQTKEDWKAGMPWIPGAVGTCQCHQAILDWKEGQSGNLGEYAPPEGLQELMTMLLNRGKSVYGYDPAAIEAMFGRGFENVRGQEVGQRERLNRTLQSQGMLGTGTAVEQGNDLGFGTETAINNLARDIMIKNEEQKRADTELSSSILGRGLGFEQLIEAINAGRRGEGQNALSMLLALLQLFKG